MTASSSWLSELRFGSIFCYCPRLDNDAKRLAYAIKDNRAIGTRSAIDWAVEVLKHHPDCSNLLNELLRDPAGTLWVPVPGHAVAPPPRNWKIGLHAGGALLYHCSARTICEKLKEHLSICWAPILSRKLSVPPSRGRASDRPLASQHAESLEWDRSVLILTGARRIVLVDDIVTRGATLLGAARCLLSTLNSDIEVFGLALVRTISQEVHFKTCLDPVLGTIRLLPDGQTQRSP